MPPAVLRSAEGVLAAATHARIIQAGNPLATDSALYDAAERRKGLYKVLRINGDPDNPARAPRVNLEWATDLVRTYGRDAPYVRANVLGLFPLQATDALLGLSHFEEARERTTTKLGEAVRTGVRVLGVDVARFGTDRSVVCVRNGDIIERFESWMAYPVDQSSDRIAGIANDCKAEYVCVDDIGVGGGVTDMLQRKVTDGELDKNLIVKGVNVGVSSDATNKDGEPLYANLKAELNLELAESIKRGEVAITEAAYNTPIVAEGTDIRYGFARGGKTLKIEDKDDFKKRNDGLSPDHWDSMVLAFVPRGLVGDIAQYGY